MCTIAVPTIPAEENLIINSGFERDRLGQLAMWVQQAYVRTPESVRIYTADTLQHSGRRAAVIANLEPNDARLVQWVRVEPETVYKLSCWVLTKEIPDGDIGANISVLGLNQWPNHIIDTGGNWKKIVTYGKTGPGQLEVAIAARLGYYSNTVTGKVAFDDISLTKVKNPQALGDTPIIPFFSENDPPSPKEGLMLEKEVILESRKSGGIPVLLFILFVILLAASVFLNFYTLDVAGFSGFIDELLRKAGVTPPQREEKKIDRRRLERKLVKCPILLQKKKRGGGYNQYECVTRDISREGVFVIVDDPDIFKLNEKIQVALIMDGKTKPAGTAKVARIAKSVNRKGNVKEIGLGLYFLTEKQSERRAINAAVKK